MPVISAFKCSFQRFPKMSKTRAAQSNPTFMPLTGSPERILSEQVLSFRTVYNHEGLGYVSDDEQEPIYTLDQALQSLHREGPPPSWRSRAQWAPAEVNSKAESDSHICEYGRRSDAHEVSFEISRRSFQGKQETVKNALPDHFTTGTAEVEGR